jgi:UDP-N-acetylmuramate--alanine ligase
MTRAELNAALFNGASSSVAIAGTSGKSTVTAMLGWILHAARRDPTIMNGAVMKNFVTEANPYASAHFGSGALYISEVDESDGSIAIYRPTVGVLLNVSLDHKSMDELRALFGDFLRASKARAVNLDDNEVRALASGLDGTTFAVDTAGADISVEPGSIVDTPAGIEATVTDARDGSSHALKLSMPGRHNLSNALAAIAGASASGVDAAEAIVALQSFAGLARRFEVIGTSASGVTVIDDFGHNPEKCAATLRTLKRHPGRVIAFFQPHGYGPLRQMGHELAETFARELGDDDLTLICDPVYFGGTVDRSGGAERVVQLIEQAGGRAEHIASRADIADRIVEVARPGDRVVVMGARDDTLTEFAKDLLARLP